MLEITTHIEPAKMQNQRLKQGSTLTIPRQYSQGCLGAEVKVPNMSTPIWTAMSTCIGLTFMFQGIVSLFSDLNHGQIPSGILFGLTITSIIQFFRIPPPPKATVEEVLGKDLFSEEKGYRMRVVGHRGVGLDCPENTIEGFNLCHQNGVDAVEWDIKLTKDKVPITFHDYNLERMCGNPLVISESTWDQLKDINLSVKHAYRDRFPVTKIPTAEQTVTQLLANDQRMLIDIKDNSFQMVRVILDLYKRHPELYNRAAITSFFPHLIYSIRKKDPRIVGCLAWRPGAFSWTCYNYPDGSYVKSANKWYFHYLALVLDYFADNLLHRLTFYILGISALLPHKDQVSGEAVINWRRRNIRLICWSVNSPVEKQHMSRNIKVTYLTDTFTGEKTAHENPKV